MENMNENIITDYITGKKIFDTGAEANRQMVEKFLIENKGYSKEDVEVDFPINLQIKGEPYNSYIDLVVKISGKMVMCIKCAPGSLGSREREILAASRLACDYQIPISIVSDGKTAIVLDTLTGKKTGEGMEEIPSKKELSDKMEKMEFIPFPEKKREKQSLIFRSYDIMNVNRKKDLS